MSYILDALKRSEEERQQGRTPTILSVHAGSQFAFRPASRRTLPTALWLAAVLTCCAAGYLLYQSRIGDAAATASIGAVEASPKATVQNAAAPAPASQAAPPPAVPAAPAAVLLERWQLPAEVAAALPPVDVSFHAYSPSPERRAVIINDRSLREGMELSPGLRLESITETGVIMAVAGYRFRVQVVDVWQQGASP